MSPNYKRIYKDFVELKQPNKKHILQKWLKNDKWTKLDLIEINKELF